MKWIYKKSKLTKETTSYEAEMKECWNLSMWFERRRVRYRTGRRDNVDERVDKRKTSVDITIMFVWCSLNYISQETDQLISWSINQRTIIRLEYSPRSKLGFIDRQVRERKATPQTPASRDRKKRLDTGWVMRRFPITSKVLTSKASNCTCQLITKNQN